MTDNNRLRSAFLAKQNHLLAALEIVPDLTGHGTTIGDDSEANWARVLREFLPARYGIAKGQVIDSQGGISDQIDLLIYDAQYTPLLAKTANGDLFVPAEAVYAVFEVKQEINRKLLEYAGKKIASVRELTRTSVNIAHAGGTYDPAERLGRSRGKGRCKCVARVKRRPPGRHRLCLTRSLVQPDRRGSNQLAGVQRARRDADVFPHPTVRPLAEGRHRRGC